MAFATFFYLVVKNKNQKIKMARRDFVKNKKVKKKRASSNKKSNFFKYMLFFLLLIILGLVIYIVMIHKNKDNLKSLEPLASQIQKSDNKKMAVAPPTETLPEQPEQRSSYLQCLELKNCDTQIDLSDDEDFNHIQTEIDVQKQQNQQAAEKQKALELFTAKSQDKPQKVEPNKAPSSISKDKILADSNAIVTYQCGAFGVLSNAESLSAKLTFLGLTNQIIQPKKLHVVVIQLSEDKVNTVLQQLKEQNINCSKHSS